MSFVWFSQTIQHIALACAFVLTLTGYLMSRRESKKARRHYNEAVRLHHEASRFYREAERLSAEDRAVLEEWTP